METRHLLCGEDRPGDVQCTTISHQPHGLVPSPGAIIATLSVAGRFQQCWMWFQLVANRTKRLQNGPQITRASLKIEPNSGASGWGCRYG